MQKTTIVAIPVAWMAVAGISFLLIFLGRTAPSLTCHRALAGEFEQWELETTNGDWYPNVNGRSANSLAAIGGYSRDLGNELRDYRYVPGLKSDDPEDLVLMYVKEPSQRKWHGDTHWFRRERRWIVINPQGQSGEGERWGEISEWIRTEEFTNRLTKTLRFLAENERSYWTNTVTEHAELLRAIQK